MKTNLLLLRKQVSVIFLLFISVGIFGQTLVNYPLDNNFNPNPVPVAGLNPSLKYFDPPSPTPINNPNHYFGHVDFANSGDFLELSFDVAANEDIKLQVNAGTAVLLSKVTGKIQIYHQVDNGPSNLLSEQNLNANATGFFQFFDATNISFDIPLVPTAAPARIKIKIIGTFTKSGLDINYFGVNNISLVKETTKISVISTKTNPVPLFINHLDGASVTRDTDFGSLLTNEDELEKTFQIKNTGTGELKINSIDVIPNNQGFTVTGPLLTTVIPNGTTTFKVKFAPINQALSTAEIFISGNIIPNNPFRFEVKGSGKSCNLTPIPIINYGFEGAAPSNMPVTPTGGYFKLISGTSTTNSPSLGTLYPTGNLYSAESPTRSLYIRGADTDAVTVEFGPIIFTDQQEVSINFEVAAFGTTDNNNSGVNNSDYVILQVYNGSTWVDALRLNGANDTTRRKYLYGASETVTKPVDDLFIPKVVSNGNKNYGKFSLKLPSSALSANFKFRIKAYTSRTRISWTDYNYNLWLIDNVHVDAGNAKVKTWDGTSWTEGRPSAREKAKFTGTYNFSAPDENIDLSICECEVAEGVNLTIPSGRALQVQNNVINDGLGDNFVVESDGNLIQIENGAQNIGSVKVERSVNGVRNDLAQHMDYIYWSSPVSGQLLKGSTGFSPGTPPNRFYRYNEPNDFFYETGDTNFVPGKGYAIRAESGLAYGYEKTYNFKGAANNGIVNIGVQRSPNNGVNNLVQHGYNMIGNPYPSNINFDLLYAVNSAVIYQTAWFWVNDNVTIYQTGSGYVGNGYAVYNGTGGNGGTTDSNPNNVEAPNGIIKVGQGFLVQMKSAPPVNPPNTDILTFNNGMRVKTAGQFYSKTDEQKDRFWLKLISPSNTASTMLLGYIAGATDDYEQDFDAEAFGLSSDLFYSVLDDKKLLIQGKADFRTEDKIVLGANFFSSGSYTISLMTAEGIFANSQPIYLKDNLLHTYTDLSSTSYTFETNAGINEGRFEIVYENNIVLATGEAAKDNLLVYRNGNSYVIETSKAMKKVEVYDASGRLMKGLNSTTKKMTVETDSWLPGIYIFKINYEDGSIKTKKVIK